LAELDQAIESNKRSTADLAREGVKASVGLERLRVAEAEAARAGVELSKAQKLAAIHGKDMSAAIQEQAATLETNTGATKAQKASSHDLALNMADLISLFGSGKPTMRAFAVEGLQMVRSLDATKKSGGALASFLGGPWPIAVGAAATALSPLIAKLFETDKGLKAVEDRAWSAIDALNALARTDTQSQIASAQGQLSRLRDEEAAQLALEERRSRDRGGFSGMAQGEIARLRHGGNAPLSPQMARIRQDILRAEQAIFNGEKSLKEQKEKEEKRENSAGRNTSSGSRRSGRSAADELARIEDRYLSELAQQQQEELRARLALTTNIDDELAIRMDLLGAERTERERQILNEKDYTAAQKQAMLEHLDLLYGKREAVGPDGAIVVQEPGLLGQAELKRITERENAMALEMLGMQADALDAQAGVALGLDERFALEKRALALQQEIEKKLLEQDIAQGRILDATQARALLEERQAAQREGLRLDQRGPLDRYSDDLNMGPEEMRRWGQQLVVDELEQLRAGMRDAITGAIGIDDPLLSGVIDMFIQQVLIAPLAEALKDAGAGDWLGGLFTSVLGIFGGGRAEGGPVSPGKIYAVNERSTAPGLFLPLAPGRIDPAGANDNGAMRGATTAGGSSHYYDLRGAVVTQDLLDQMNQIARGEAQAAVAGYDQVAASRVQDTLERRQ